VNLRNLHSRRLAAWLAFVAILLQAAGPTLAFARGPARGAVEIEICTSLGIGKISVDADGQAGRPSGTLDQHVHHCVLCHSGGGAMPAAGLRVEPPGPIAVSLAVPPESAVQPPNPFLAWFVLRKHGPPLPA
jgi:hypothetical protein